MISINNDTIQAWLSDRKVNTVTISFPQISKTYGIDDIDCDSFSLKESLCNADEMEFVGCIASSLKVAIYNIPNNVKGKRITVTVKAGNTETIPLFTGIVDSVEIDSDSKFKNIVAYDDLYTAGQVDVASWYARLSLPMTLGAIRASLMAYVGLTEVTGTSLPNDNVTIYRTLENPDTIQALTVIKSICQLNGACGIINREGKFEYRYIQTSIQTSYHLPFYEVLKYEEFYCKAIQRVQIRDTEEDAGVTTSSVGNKYIIQGNMFAYELATDVLRTMAANVLNKINGFTYHPMRSIQNGLPFIEVGDTIEYDVSAEGYGVDTFLILSRTISGIQFCRDTFESRGVQDQSEYISDIQAQVDVLKRTTNELKNLSSKIVDYILPVNIEESNIASGSNSDVIEFEFYSNDEEEKSSFYASVDFNIATDTDLVNDVYGDCTLTVTYYKDGTALEVQTHTFGDGYNMLMLNYLLNNMSVGNHTFKIRFALSGGSMSSIQVISAYLLAATAVESGNYEEEYEYGDDEEFAEFMTDEGSDVVGDFVELTPPNGGKGTFSGDAFCDDWMTAFIMPFEYMKIFDTKHGWSGTWYPSTDDDSEWNGTGTGNERFNAYDSDHGGFKEDLIPKYIDDYIFDTYGKHVNMWFAKVDYYNYIYGQSRYFRMMGAYVDHANFKCTGNYPRQGYSTFTMTGATGTFQHSDFFMHQVYGNAFVAGGGSSGGTVDFVLVYNTDAFLTYLSGLTDAQVYQLAYSWFILAECNIKKEKKSGQTDWSDNDDYHGE